MPTRPLTHHQRLRAGGRLPTHDDSRGTAAQRGYGNQWRKLRLAFLERNPLCFNFANCRNGASLVDHIKPISDGGAVLDLRNLRSCCVDCHAVLTRNYKLHGVNELSLGGRS